MAFTAADVKKLREMTNVGMMDCKKALAETDGDMDKAIEYLREKGLAKAAKKAGRIAAEGMAYAAVLDGTGVIVEVNAETDFASKTPVFTGFVSDIAAAVAASDAADVEALKSVNSPASPRTPPLLTCTAAAVSAFWSTWLSRAALTPPRSARTLPCRSLL